MSSDKRIIILAAGSSERMGTPKQLLKFRNLTLIMHSVTEAYKALHEPPVVVTGEYRELIVKELEGMATELVFNPEWRTGMASSIIAGLKYAMKDPCLTGALIVLTDQPFVNSELLTEMFRMQSECGKPIIACCYADGTVGTPVLYNKQIFNELMHLSGQEGARKIVRMQPDRVATISFPDGGIDIDTIEDYTKLVDDN